MFLIRFFFFFPPFYVDRLKSFPACSRWVVFLFAAWPLFYSVRIHWSGSLPSSRAKALRNLVIQPPCRVESRGSSTVLLPTSHTYNVRYVTQRSASPTTPRATGQHPLQGKEIGSNFNYFYISKRLAGSGRGRSYLICQNRASSTVRMRLEFRQLKRQTSPSL